MTITAGVDLGTGTIKTVLFSIEDDNIEWLARRADRIRQRAYSTACELGRAQCTRLNWPKKVMTACLP